MAALATLEADPISVPRYQNWDRVTMSSIKGKTYNSSHQFRGRQSVKATPMYEQISPLVQRHTLHSYRMVTTRLCLLSAYWQMFRYLWPLVSNRIPVPTGVVNIAKE